MCNVAALAAWHRGASLRSGANDHKLQVDPNADTRASGNHEFRGDRFKAKRKPRHHSLTVYVHVLLPAYG